MHPMLLDPALAHLALDIVIHADPTLCSIFDTTGRGTSWYVNNGLLPLGSL